MDRWAFENITRSQLFHCSCLCCTEVANKCHCTFQANGCRFFIGISLDPSVLLSRKTPLYTAGLTVKPFTVLCPLKSAILQPPSTVMTQNQLAFNTLLTRLRCLNSVCVHNCSLALVVAVHLYSIHVGSCKDLPSAMFSFILSPGDNRWEHTHSHRGGPQCLG